MSSPTSGSDPNHPEGASPEAQPGWSTPPPAESYTAPAQNYPPPAQNYPPAENYGPAPGYSSAPGYSPPTGYPPAPAGYGAATGSRPGMVTGAAIVGIVWGGLGTLFGLLAMSVAFSLSGLLGVIVLIALLLAIALLVGGIFILTGRDPKLLLYTSYVAIAINIVELIISIAQNGGSAFNGVLGFILPGVIVALLFQQQSRQYFAARGQTY